MEHHASIETVDQSANTTALLNIVKSHRNGEMDYDHSENVGLNDLR